MKKFIVAAAAGLFALSAVVALPLSANAAVQWNGTQYGTNCPTVEIANYSTGAGMSGCWGTSATADAGQTIDVGIYYFNSGTSVADNTILRLNPPPTGPITDYTFNGYISGGNTSTSGSASIHLTSAQTLTLHNVYWYPDGTVQASGLPNGQTAQQFVSTSGVNIGSIYPPSDCSATHNSKCHAGYVDVSFIVGNAATPTCTVNSFTANPTSVAYNGSSSLSWSTSNCTNVSVTGPGVNNYQTNASGVSTGPLANTATYTINANGSSGAPVSRSVTVNVGAAANCAVNSFYANPTSVTSGGTSTLTWSTSNCTTVTVAGPMGTLSTQKSGSISTGGLTQTSNFTITASGSSGAPITQNATVTVNGGGSTGCTINSFYASPSNITSGQTSTLIWSTTGCGSATVYGNGVSSSLLNGSIQTPQLYSSTTYTITAYANFGGTPVTQNAIVNVNGGGGNPTTCAITSFQAYPSSVQSGQSSTITWATSGCTSATVSGLNVSSSQLSGSVSTGALFNNASYTLTAYGTSGIPMTQTISVTVNATSACTIASFTANPPVVQAGNLSTLTWSTPGCTNVMISGGTQYSNTPIYSNSISTEPLYNTTTYTLSAYGSGSYGSGTISSPVTQSVTVTVQNTQSQCIINSFYASPTYVQQGGSATLYWNTIGCTNVSVNGPGINSYAYTNSQPIGPIYGTQTYTITASSNYGAPITQSTTVTASTYQNNTPPQVTTSPATNIADTSATLNGYISYGSCAPTIYTGGYNYNNNCTNTYNNNCNVYPYNCSNNYSNYTSYYFMYGTSQYGLTQQTPTQTLNGGSSGNAYAYVSNLLPNTTYYFQLVGTSSYGTSDGSILSFVTTGSQNAQISAITTVATNITATSARLNGIVTGPSNVPIQTYFEYGTSPSLGTQTGLQTVSTYTVTNYFDTITTIPNTTYYYRIVGLSNGQTYPGATVSFTSGSNTIVTPPVVITRVVNGTGGGSAYVALSITDQSQNVFPSNTINYVVTYQNISSSTLSNAVLDVILPSGVTYQSSSQGVLTTNNTVAVTLGTLAPNGPAQTVNITGVVDANAVPGNNFVTTATLAFTTPGGAQDSAIAYVLNNVTTQNSLAGLALFGAGFFPNTLLGWIILIGLILILILIARYFYHRANAEQAAQAPVTHVHYDTPAPMNNNHGGGYPGSNLPH